VARAFNASAKTALARAAGAAALVVVASLITACSPPSKLERVRQEKVLHVITRNAPSVYYEGRDGPAGFEYELARLFAKDLGVKLRVRVADNMQQIFSVLNQGYTDFAAAGLAVNPERGQHYRFSPVYLTAKPTIIYRAGSKRPSKPGDLSGRKILVIDHTNLLVRLQDLKKKYPGIRIETRNDMDSIDVLQQVNDGNVDLAVVDSNELDMNKVFFPKVRQAFKLKPPEDFAWFFPSGADNSLVKRARAFFRHIREDGTLAQLKERYYGHLDQLNYVGARTFIRDVQHRLPRYEEAFRRAGTLTHIDWRLLAAVGYQESHWKPDAVSPTGVRGLMMLTRDTAQDIGVNNRLDPDASIVGGARYLARVIQEIPDHIPDPDRTWFALASYNVGYGHVEDARVLAQEAGKNPDRWMDVKRFLPLLAHKKWYKKTKHGYARGQEPVLYVQNIRRYYDVLSWMTQPSQNGEMLASQAPDKPSPAPDKPGALREVKLPSGLSITPPTL